MDKPKDIQKQIVEDCYTWVFPPCPGCGDPAGECENQSCVRMEEEQEIYQ